MLPAFLILAASLLPAAYAADTVDAPIAERAFGVAPELSLDALPEGTADYLTPEAIERQKSAHDWLNSMNLPSRAVESSTQYMKDNREKLMELVRQVDQSLGIREQSGSLLVFLSHSMSDEFIRSYLHEGAWSGAGFYVRGIPAGMNLKQYLGKKLAPLVGRKRGSAINIDPKLFGLYGVTHVPTIVWDPGDRSECSGEREAPMKDDQGNVQTIPMCTGTDGDYWKISGGVSIDYALRRFAKAGAPGAQERLDVLRTNLDPANDGDAEQLAYEGDWDTVAMPAKNLLEQFSPVTDRDYLAPPDDVIENTSTVEGKTP